MRTLTRRVAPAAVAMAALIVAAVPGTAAAKKVKTDQLGQCEGAASIEGLGSTFQAPAEFLWTGEKYPTLGFNVSTSKLACSGAHKPTVKYNNSAEQYKGSGNCLKDMGSAGHPKIKEFPFCGTDEAPSKTVKEAMETTAGLSGGNGEGIQTIPVLQGAVAVIVHLPAGCTATSEPKLNKHVTAIDRLSLERSVVEGIYDGSAEYDTWKKALSHNASAKNELHCTHPAEEEEEITRVVRLDKSGTTHIFKSFLEQLEGEAGVEKEPLMEEFGDINEKSTGKEEVYPCGGVTKLPAAKETWATVTEGCENQRWPKGATKEVVRGIETGNPGVIKTVTATPSSIGYADLAVAREKGGFNPPTGGESTSKFWVPISNSKAGSRTVEYQDPSTNGDAEALGNSNCVKTVYALKAGEKFPPDSTRADWSKVKGLVEGKTYPICGLTYVLAPRLYYPFLSHEGTITQEESQKIATTVSNYLVWVLSEKTEGGGAQVLGHDYEPLPKKAQKVAEAGALEIGSKEA